MSAEQPEPAVMAAVAGLAREVEGLRRAVEQATAVAGRVEELAAVVARVAEETAAQAGDQEEGKVTPSWLDLALDVPATAAVLAELVGWMGVVYLRYADAALTLPECWLWHPDVVEELLWLMHAWLAAYRVKGAPVSLAADWHDRLRPGVVRRIKATAGTCSLESHQPGGEKHTAALDALLAEASGLIAAWWATSRRAEPPAPTEEHLAAAAAGRVPRGRM